MIDASVSSDHVHVPPHGRVRVSAETDPHQVASLKQKAATGELAAAYPTASRGITIGGATTAVAPAPTLVPASSSSDDSDFGDDWWHYFLLVLVIVFFLSWVAFAVWWFVMRKKNPTQVEVVDPIQKALVTLKDNYTHEGAAIIA